MSQSAKTEGACTFCGKRSTRGGMSRHLQTCPARKEAIRAADAGSGEREPIFHLQAQDAGAGDFWLHLEMRGSATMKKLDEYLRAIWLECCGHMSDFSRGRSTSTIALSRRAEQALDEGMAFVHRYDFGSTTETSLKVVGIRQGRALDRRPIRLMARNEMPPYTCAECGAPGTRLCLECMYDGTNPVLCEAHAEAHPHEEYGAPMPLVNSPRSGVCGYDGPAEPPY
jgi:hypothetical protein